MTDSPWLKVSSRGPQQLLWPYMASIMYNSAHDFQFPPLHFLERVIRLLSQWLLACISSERKFLSSTPPIPGIPSSQFFPDHLPCKVFPALLHLLLAPFMAHGVSQTPHLFVGLFIVCFCQQSVSHRRACLTAPC